LPDEDIKRADREELNPYLERQPVHKLTDKQALLRVMNDYREAQAAKDNALTRAVRYDAMYQALDAPDEAIDQTTGLIEDDESMYSNTYMPIGAAIVDSAIAQLFNLIFATEDYFKIEADDIEDMLFETEVTAFFKKRHKEMGFKHKVYQALSQACCFDYAVTHTRWLMEGGYEPRPVRRIEEVKLGATMLRKQTVRAETMYVPDKIDRSDLQVLNFMRCYPDPLATDGFNDSRFFVDDFDIALEDLIAQSENMVPWGKYKNIEKIVAETKEELDSGQVYNVDYSKSRDTEIRKTILHSRKRTVIRYWTKHHIIKVCQGHIIQRQNIPGWPLQEWSIFPKPVPSFGGMGFLQRIERNGYDINASLNSRRNLQNLISNPFAVIDQELIGSEEGEPRLWPGKVMVSRGGNANDKIFVYTPGANTNQDAIADVNMQMEMTQRVSSVDENAFGIIRGDRTTATEVRQAAAGRMTRLGVTAQRLEEQCLEKIYINHFHLEMTFLTKTEFVRYFGDKGEQMLAVDSASFMWNKMPRFVAMGTFSVLEDAVKMQQFFTAVQLAAGMPQVQFNWNNIALQVFRYLHPKEYYKFVKDPNIPSENIPPDIENMLIAQGRVVRRSPANNDGEHLPVHESVKLTKDYQIWPQARRLLLDQHINEHKAGQGAVANAPSLQKMLGRQQDSADSLRGIRPGLNAQVAA